MFISHLFKNRGRSNKKTNIPKNLRHPIKKILCCFRFKLEINLKKQKHQGPFPNKGVHHPSHVPKVPTQRPQRLLNHPVERQPNESGYLHLPVIEPRTAVGRRWRPHQKRTTTNTGRSAAPKRFSGQIRS